MIEQGLPENSGPETPREIRAAYQKRLVQPPPSDEERPHPPSNVVDRAPDESVIPSPSNPPTSAPTTLLSSVMEQSEGSSNQAPEQRTRERPVIDLTGDDSTNKPSRSSPTAEWKASRQVSRDGKKDKLPKDGWIHVPFKENFLYHTKRFLMINFKR